MKNVVRLLCLMVSVGWTRGRQVECVPSDGSDGPINNYVRGVLSSNLLQCMTMNTPALRVAVNMANNTQDYRQVFKEYCATIPDNVVCRVKVMSYPEKCMDDDDKTFFTLMEDNVQMMLDIGCEGEGKRLADIFQEGRKISVRGQEPNVGRCFGHRLARASDFAGGNTAERTAAIYRFLQRYQKCTGEDLEGVETFEKLVQGLVRDILERMKCATHQGNKGILCQQIIKE